jgi:FtsP/CotA-like multicopper oxidase with cupredoxin domain
MHWHGITQQNSCTQDGVNGVTECPIPPGATRTYKFQATEFGTTWYHSHFTYQYGDGIVGTIIVNGPATADYDIDLGTMPITDFYYESTWIAGHAAETSGPPKGDNILVNGTNVNLQGTGGFYSNTTLVKGNKYLLRLVNTAVDNGYMVSLDNHQFTVVQADFVPIKPYTADWVFLGIGQRLDVVFIADQGSLPNYWFRAMVPSGCGVNLNNKTTVAIFNYEGSNIDIPTSTASSYTPRCYDETSLIPHIGKSVSQDDFKTTYGAQNNTLTVNLATVQEQDHKIFRWTINNSSINVDWENPTLQYIAESNNTYNAIRELNLYELPTANVWSFWVIQNNFSVAHPIHLHGHDFYQLGVSPNVVSKTPIEFTENNIADLNFDNPTRRDVAMLPGYGWLVLAFRTDNPGAWLMHCHIAWHISEGLGVQFLERASEINGLMDTTKIKEDCDAWSSWYNSGPATKDDSGI